MTDDDWQRRHDVLHEALDTKLDAILEFVSVIPEMREDVRQVKADVADLKGRSIVLEEVVRQHSGDISALKEASHIH